MTERQIIKELCSKIDLTDLGLLKYLKKHYPDVDGRRYRKLIRLTREESKLAECEIQPPFPFEEEEALNIWIKTLDLIDRSILEPVDHLVLYDYCNEKYLYYKYSKKVAELPNEGILLSKSGAPYQHPLIGMANTKKALCEKTEHRFGFDPSGRRKNGYVKKKSKQSALTALIGKKKSRTV